MSSKNVGGLVSNVYEMCLSAGQMFFVVLIGRKRAYRQQLEGQSVAIGGLLFGALAGGLAGIVSFFFSDSTEGKNISIVVFILIGSFLCWVISLIVLGYVRSVDKEIAREERNKKEAVEYAEKLAKLEERVKQLISNGMEPEAATAQAKRELRIYESGHCFIATACFGYDGREVKTLRTWRDTVLMESAYGRRLVRYYYKISPPIAIYITSRPLIKSLFAAMIRCFVFCLKDLRCKPE